MVRFYFLIFTIFLGGCIATTHHKDKLLDPEKLGKQTNGLKTKGFYYSKIDLNNVKYINALILYNDGFVINCGLYEGITDSYCKIGSELKIENSFENSIYKFESQLLFLTKEDSLKVYKSCQFLDNDLDKKGLFEVNNDSIIIQYYRAESKKPNKDSFNSYYLYELQGVIIDSESFKILKKVDYRNNNVEDLDLVFNFKPNENVPKVSNYFK